MSALDKPLNLRAYISGPMSGHADLNRAAFDTAKHALQGRGYQVVSPHGLAVTPTDGEDLTEPQIWLAAMAQDLRALGECDLVLLLPGWEKSPGAVIEAIAARRLNIPTYTSAPGTDWGLLTPRHQREAIQLAAAAYAEGLRAGLPTPRQTPQPIAEVAGILQGLDQ